MRIVAIITATLGFLSLLVLGYLIYLGLLKEIQVDEVELGPYWLVYESQIGDYDQTFETMEKVKAELNSREVTVEATAAIYYSDPEKVPIEEWESDAGVLLARTDYDKKEENAGQWELKELPYGRYMKVSFPYHNMMSVFLTILKVYPALMEYIREKGYKRTHGIEIYKDDEILVLMPILKE